MFNLKYVFSKIDFAEGEGLNLPKDKLFTSNKDLFSFICSVRENRLLDSMEMCNLFSYTNTELHIELKTGIEINAVMDNDDYIITIIYGKIMEIGEGEFSITVYPMMTKIILHMDKQITVELHNDNSSVSYHRIHITKFNSDMSIGNSYSEIGGHEKIYLDKRFYNQVRLHI